MTFVKDFFLSLKVKASGFIPNHRGLEELVGTVSNLGSWVYHGYVTYTMGPPNLHFYRFLWYMTWFFRWPKPLFWWLMVSFLPGFLESLRFFSTAHGFAVKPAVVHERSRWTQISADAQDDIVKDCFFFHRLDLVIVGDLYLDVHGT